VALIKCEDCGKEISDKAKACIHCGCPVPINELKKEQQRFINVLVNIQAKRAKVSKTEALNLYKDNKNDTFQTFTPISSSTHLITRCERCGKIHNIAWGDVTKGVSDIYKVKNPYKCGCGFLMKVVKEGNNTVSGIPSSKSPKSNPINGCSIVLVIFLILLIGIGYSCSKMSSNTASNASADDGKIMAWTVAKDAVTQNLKSPSTAKFPFSSVSEGVTITEDGVDRWTVSSWVDAQNGFGAMIRQNFTVDIIKDGESYRYENLNIY